MSKNCNGLGGTGGGAVLWLLLAGAVAAVAFLVLRRPTPPAPRPEIVVATPAPHTPAPAPPEPVIVRATPAPRPVAVATPTPPPATPPPLDLATVARTPALWPPQVGLVQPVDFPLSLNGRVVGQGKAPVGTALRVLRVAGSQVEVEYQAARHLIPAASTDLLPRALAIFRRNGSSLPSAPAPVIAAPTALSAMTPPPAARAPAVTGLGAVKMAERLGIEVVRMRRSRIEGGDYDDKRERIELKVKLANTDTALSADKFKGEIFIFAESILDRSAVKLLTAEQFDFSLPPRGNYEFVTTEVVTMYDTTGARFGHKYEGWFLRLRDSTGSIVLTKSSSPTLQKGAEKAAGLTKDASYDRVTFKQKTASP